MLLIRNMTITQTIDIPADRRITLEVPREVPTGSVILTFTPAKAEVKRKVTEAEEIEYINRHADRLNAEARSYARLSIPITMK